MAWRRKLAYRVTDEVVHAAVGRWPLSVAADRIGHHLLDSGVRAGEHVGLHLYNGVEYVQTLLGCMKARSS